MPPTVTQDFEELGDAQDFAWEANFDGTADAMTSVPADELAEWVEAAGADIEKLPTGYVVWFVVHIKADKALAVYLKRDNASFETGAYHPSAFQYAALAAFEAMHKITEQGWEPSRVDVVVRYAPRSSQKVG